MIRTTAVTVLFSLAAVTLLIGNLAVWAERTVFNTDQFVSTTTNVLDTPDVRQHAAENLANQLLVRSELDARLQTQLGPGLGFLVQPLTDATHDTLTTVILRALDRTLTPDREDRILTALHTQVMDVLQGRTAVQSNGEEIYIDLHDVLVSAASDIGLSQATTQGAINRLDLPPESGRIVISSDSQRFDTLSWIARHHRAIGLALIAIPLFFFLAAIAVARHRRRAVRNTGFIVVGVAAFSLLALIPLRAFVGSFARDPAVGREAFSALVTGFRWQTFVLMLLGAVVAAAAIFVGIWRRNPDLHPTTEALRRRLPLFRLTGFGVAALILIAWPSPGWRAYVVTLGLLAGYLALLWVCTSESPTASQLRQRERPGAPHVPGWRGWVAAHASWLRAGGLILAVIAIVAIPAVTWRAAAFVLICAMGYLALIEWAASGVEPVPSAQPDERARDGRAPSPTPATVPPRDRANEDR